MTTYAQPFTPNRLPNLFDAPSGTKGMAGVPAMNAAQMGNMKAGIAGMGLGRANFGNAMLNKLGAAHWTPGSAFHPMQLQAGLNQRQLNRFNRWSMGDQFQANRSAYNASLQPVQLPFQTLTPGARSTVAGTAQAAPALGGWGGQTPYPQAFYE